MPNGNGNNLLSQIGYPVMVAVLIAIAAFTSSRAGHDDLDRVERKGEEREERVLAEIEKVEETVAGLEEKVHKAEVEQAEFRAQVRAALRISEEQ
jgi:phage shock protein A